MIFHIERLFLFAASFIAVFLDAGHREFYNAWVYVPIRLVR